MVIISFMRYAALLLFMFVLVSCLYSCTSKNGSGQSGTDSASDTTGKNETSGDEKAVSSEEGKSSAADYAPGEFEPYPVFRASEILPPELLKGEYHEVEEAVRGDCIQNSYTIKSDFGTYEARNTHMLEIRIREIQATAELKKKSGAEALAVGAAHTVIDPFKSAMNVASKPVETAKGVPGGIVTFFKKIYYTGEKAVTVAGKTAKSTGKAITGGNNSVDGEDGGDTAGFYELSGDVEYLVDWYLGVSGGERRLARELNVDPYTSNPELAAELKRVAKYDRIGRLGIGFTSTPSVPGMGYVKDVNYYVWSKDPKELREFNKKTLIGMDVDPVLVQEFLDSPYYSPSFQTTVTLSMKELEGVSNREEIIEDALAASTIPEAEYFVKIVVLLTWYHNNESEFQTILNHGDITSGLTRDERIITILPVDYLCWSEDVASAARFHDEVFRDVNAESRELWVVGDISGKAQSEITALGWEVYDGVTVITPARSPQQEKEETVRGVNREALDVLQKPYDDSSKPEEKPAE